VLVPTTYVDAGTLTAEIPAEMAGAEGTQVQVLVWVQNADGTPSNGVVFVVLFPAVLLQAWTSVDKVAAEIPGFARGLRIKDTDIQTWIRSVGQEVAAEMLRRGLSMDPATWTAAAVQGPGPNPSDVLEMINRMGAAMRLAAAVGANMPQEWGVAKGLERAYLRQLAALRAGDYDKIFLPSAATVEAGPQVSYGDMTGRDGSSSTAFRKDKRF
jgi:hypothetical protein